MGSDCPLVARGTLPGPQSLSSAQWRDPPGSHPVQLRQGSPLFALFGAQVPSLSKDLGAELLPMALGAIHMTTLQVQQAQDLNTGSPGKMAGLQKQGRENKVLQGADFGSEPVQGHWRAREQTCPLGLSVEGACKEYLPPSSSAFSEWTLR